MLRIQYSPRPVLEPVPGCPWAEAVVLNPAFVPDPHIGLVAMHWRTAWAREYEVQVAIEAPENWQTVHHTDAGRDGVAVIALPEGTKARYVRVLGIRRGSPCGYALSNFEVFGQAPDQ